MQLDLYIRFISFIFAALLFTNTSTATAQDENSEINKYIYKIMKKDKWYLWHDSIPQISLDDKKDSKEFIKSLRFSKFDKWSYIDDEKNFNMYYNNGQYIGHGFSKSMGTDSIMRICYVYRNSPMEKAGIKRGYEILKINNKKIQKIEDKKLWNKVFGDDKIGEKNSFTFKDEKGRIFRKRISKDIVTQNNIYYKSIIEIDTLKIGYFVFISFVNPARAQLDSVFSEFNRNHVNELILDLRYNGGGNLHVANYLANLIAGKNNNGKVFGKMIYSKQKSSHNTIFTLKKLTNSIDLKRIVIITSKMTASASEYLINCLKPYMDVELIGDDTNGKPVGMNVFRFKNKVIVPICFQLVDANNSGNYFEGIDVNCQRKDDFSKDLGNTSENCLKEALHYLKTGSYSIIEEARNH